MSRVASKTSKGKKKAEAGPKQVSLRTLAEHLGLSRASVSFVLNDSPMAQTLSAATRQRILKAAEELNYRPNYFARCLNKKRSYLVGVLVPELGEGYVAGILAGIERELLQDKYVYFVSSHQWVPKLIEETPRLLVERGADGVILVNTPLSHAMPFPTVNVGGHKKLTSVANIHLDNRAGAALALEHLAQQGHRRIAFFRGHAESADTEDRWAGICETAARLRISIDPELVVQLDKSLMPPGPSGPEEGYLFGQKLLARRKKFSALFAFNDMSAIGAMSAFRDAGFRLPEDISVVGFDDVHGAAFAYPPLTTVRQPLEEMGELAAQTLLHRIEKGARRADQILLKPKLVVRKSVALAEN
ncbi:MAG: LacI family DNA-binding transcriptional regulator [Acidobacteria bacterium]|nr:LacI family DNA-binding transcriptional regulator [Acidobacteriota bacterium]